MSWHQIHPTALGGNVEHVADWERTRALLLEKERHLLHLSVRCARGAVTSEQLSAARGELEDLRRLDGLKFKRAFPHAEA